MNEAEWRQTYGVSGSENLPLVTIIAINWNYATYLLTALRSAVAQDYPRLEIIVLDNGSQDDSPSLISAFVEQHPQVRFIQLMRNIGQFGAAHHILTQHRVAGDFASFLDTDDFLFPHFISHHIRAHLLLNNGADVSTGDTLQIDQNGTIVAGNMPHWWKKPAADRPGWVETRVSTHHDTPRQLSLTLIPPSQRRWFWHPGTSIVYRRQKIERLMQAIRDPIEVKFALDASAAPFCHTEGGSIMLNEPLSGYRIHGRNSSVTAPQLQHLDSGRASFVKGNKRQERWFRKNFRKQRTA
ncbi:glycosyltransferase family A protein [Kaistia defluvii]|uniref:glycosyltransferase family 2 protein n=1 Tax=Kaistia defluvii TaxID=410841 RepID=UPI00225B18F9|nr:glycosyltransferase family A protein [Kaistia defluvii]MCX5516871.1 glycosyltransferase family A protein [Kaistia defluvii]